VKHLLPFTALLLAPLPALQAGDAPRPVKVFILAGQSNMEGKAPNALLNYQASDPRTRDLFTHLRKDNRWIVRDDVFIKFLDRKGPLTVGYGSPGCTGVELEFGTVLGNHFEEPVLLIKAAWGGHSLVKLFRSPSAGFPAREVLQRDLDQAQARVRKNNEKSSRNDPLPTLEDVKKEYGSSYRKMMTEVKDVLDSYATLFPALKGKKLELAGFVWFQGWNDQYGGQDEYESNMKHFIRDVRRDLKVPKMPFVIGAMGQNGSKPARGAMQTIQKAQLAMNDVAEFKGNVKAIRTDVLVDRAAEELYPSWRMNLEKWKRTGGDHAYHYLGSAIWFNRIGKAMGEAMLELLRKPRSDPEYARTAVRLALRVAGQRSARQAITCLIGSAPSTPTSRWSRPL
jgi:alpha-galactosidase